MCVGAARAPGRLWPRSTGRLCGTSYSGQAALVGKTLKVLVEGYDRFGECWYGRSYMEAPDIDGKIFFTGESSVQPGEMLDVTIEEAMDFDLIGRIEE